MKKYIFLTIFIMLLVLLSGLALLSRQSHPWSVKSIDTMKYSRDPSREKLHDASFDKVIDQQVAAIARTGATHVAIATPYDEEFVPMLRRWVAAARKHKLHVWFRGNLSGWEGWFDYPKIDKARHTAEIEQFILNHTDLFENGDIFTSCPECENGSEVNFGDEKEVKAYRNFLINEYSVSKQAFNKLGKSIIANYYSMNGDVARIVMDRETTKALDGVVTIDHYVSTPEQLVQDIKFYAEHSGGKVVLGEFGAPIPDIHGEMSEEAQKQWIEKALKMLIVLEELEGINYWVNMGGSTALWQDNTTPKLAVKTLTEIFKRTR